MASRQNIQYSRVPTSDDEEYHLYNEACLACCPIRFSVPEQYRGSNNHFSEIQGSHRRDGDREAVAQAPRAAGTLMRWSVTSVSTSGRGERRRRSDSAPETSTNELADRQQSVSREPNRTRTSSIELSSNNNTGTICRPRALQRPPQVDAAFLSTLNTDIYIVPVEFVNSFVPESIPRSIFNSIPAELTVVQVDEPRPIIVIDVMSQFKPVEPVLENPLVNSLHLQRDTAHELLYDVNRMKLAYEGFVMTNMERDAEFPFISFFNMNKNQQDPLEAFSVLQHMAYEKYDPRITRYTATHILHMFTEVASIVRPPLNIASRRPLSRNTGYIITVYKVLNGDDGERLERNWLSWTGARVLYCSIPPSAGLRRITFHKSLSRGDKYYVLVCECTNFMANMSSIISLIPSLRGRLCGCPGVFRATATF